MQRLRLQLLFITAAVVFTVPTFADSIRLNPNQFGHLDQNDPRLAGVCGAGGVSYACGPVAAVNSFVFLQNTRNDIYDNFLINPDTVGTATTLAGANFMSCAACAGGTSTAKFISGKMKYIENRIPGKTLYADVQNPGFPFLLNELQRHEDVELIVGFYDANNTRVGGHIVTLYQVSGGGGMDPNTLSFVDPDGPTTAGGLALNMDNLGYVVNGNGIIQIGNYGPAGTTARVDWAVAESPIPEPVGLLLLGALAIFGFAVRGRTCGGL